MPEGHSGRDLSAVTGRGEGLTLPICHRRTTFGEIQSRPWNTAMHALLLAAGLVPSGLVVHRAQYEATFRSVWVPARR